MNARFLIFTDLHADIMHDAAARMQAICRAAVDENVDFILHLGDIMYPEAAFLAEHAPESLEKRSEAWFLCDRDDEKLAIKRYLRDTGKRVYGVLGNHDMDSCSKRTACLYWGMPAPHYSFIQGGIRFIALDANYIKTDSGYIDFDHNNYKHYKRRQTSFLPPEELVWLESELTASAEPCVLLSHASLADDILNVNNMRDVWSIIARANASGRRVILGINGHSHVDGLTARTGVPFININSASNIWLGSAYRTVRYSETLCRTYPHLSSCAPYAAPLYTIMTISDSGISMTGAESSFVGKTPQQLAFPLSDSYFKPSARISPREIPLGFFDGDGAIDNRNE